MTEPLQGNSISWKAFHCLWHLIGKPHSLFVRLNGSISASMSVSLPFFLFLYFLITPLPAVSFFLSSSFSPLLFYPHYLWTPFSWNLSLTYFHFLSRPPPTFQPARLPPSIIILFHYSGIQATTDRQACLSLSLFLLSPSSLLSLALLVSSKQQRAVKLISWPEQTKPKPHSPSSICCYVSALWIGSFQAWSLEE